MVPFSSAAVGTFYSALDKRQSWLSDYERAELATITDAFVCLDEARRTRGLFGSVEIRFNASVDRVSASQIVSAVHSCFSNLNPYGTVNEPWGAVSVAPLNPAIDIRDETRLYSPDFLSEVFQWSSEAGEFEGIYASAQNSRSIRAGRAQLPFCLKWRVDAEDAMERKARQVVRLWLEAIDQIPDGHAGFIYLAYQDTLRTEVSDRRTQKLQELIQNFHFRRRLVFMLRIVVNRLYPMAIAEGRPDQVENAVAIGPDIPNDVLGRYLPTKVFTPDCPDV
jgi:hypothetical protein